MFYDRLEEEITIEIRSSEEKKLRMSSIFHGWLAVRENWMPKRTFRTFKQIVWFRCFKL